MSRAKRAGGPGGGGGMSRIAPFNNVDATLRNYTISFISKKAAENEKNEILLSWSAYFRVRMSPPPSSSSFHPKKTWYHPIFT